MYIEYNAGASEYQLINSSNGDVECTISGDFVEEAFGALGESPQMDRAACVLGYFAIVDALKKDNPLVDYVIGKLIRSTVD